MKVALAQINPIIGNFSYNYVKILKFAEDAHKLGADVVIFPEMAVTGYPPQDLLDKPQFLKDSQRWIEKLAAAFPPVTGVCGFVEPNDRPGEKAAFNAAAIISDRKITAVHRKSLLPTYDVFDEGRYFESARELRPEVIADTCMGITICEDIWNETEVGGKTIYHNDPVDALVQQGAKMILNCSASPFYMGKWETRLKVLQQLVKEHHLPIVYVNQVGGNDSLIFDGASLVLNSEGKIAVQAAAFTEDLLIWDTANIQPTRQESYPGGIGSIYDALTLGIRDYAGKLGFKKAILGLSGGIDSAVTACLGVAALGRENVVTVAMPSRYSAKASMEDAIQLAKNLDIELKVYPIDGLFQQYLNTFNKEFEGLESDVTEENLQSRIRGNILMGLSNKFGFLVLTTGNKSELASGYCTLYGDMAGGLSVLADATKRTVYNLADYLNRVSEVIPQRIITKAPSAELRHNQRDQDSLPPYHIMDEIIHLFIEGNLTSQEIIARGFEPATVRDVVRRINRNEYKRRQAPLGLKVSSKAFSMGRRYPICHRYDWE